MKGGGSSQCKIELSDFYQHNKHVFADDSIFSSEHVEQFINQNFNTKVNYTETEQQYDTSLLDAPITRDEVQTAISKLKRNKSPGLDLLSPELFIDAADLLADPLCKLFNFIFENNLYSESWTRGIVVPVPKKEICQMSIIIGA